MYDIVKELCIHTCMFSNSSPISRSGALPWRVPIIPGVQEYRLQVNVTDSLNLTDSAVIEYQGTVHMHGHACHATL